MKHNEKAVMNIVNQLFDLAEISVEKRQLINDTADKFINDNFFVSYRPSEPPASDTNCK